MTASGSGGSLAGFVWAAVVLRYAALSSVWTAHGPGWCAQLTKPSFRPPDGVFAVIRPLAFLALVGEGLWFTRSAAVSTEPRAEDTSITGRGHPVR